MSEVIPNCEFDGNYPEHDPRLGYYVYRGLPCTNNRDYLGPHWTEDPCLAYMFTKNEEGNHGDFFVAYVPFEELLIKDSGVSSCMEAGIGEEYLESLKEYKLVQLCLLESPNRVKLVTPEELEAIFFDRPDPDVYSVVHSRYEDTVNWRLRSQSVFEDKL